MVYCIFGNICRINGVPKACQTTEKIRPACGCEANEGGLGKLGNGRVEKRVRVEVNVRLERCCGLKFRGVWQI